jgi:hypothetical protein
MSETGPTGSDVDTLLSIINTGLTGNALAEYNMMMNQPMPGPIGVDPSILAMFPNVATGPVEPPHIVSLEELMASHSATIAKETEDTESLKALVSPSRDTFRPQLFQWATAGFPDLYVVQSFTIAPPAICADGVTREIGKYIEYCIEKNLGEVIDGLKALMTGIQPSWSMSGSTLRIHVSKL